MTEWNGAKADAAARLLELIRIRLISGSIYVVAALGIADLPADAPMSIEQLTEAHFDQFLQFRRYLSQRFQRVIDGDQLRTFERAIRDSGCQCDEHLIPAAFACLPLAYLVKYDAAHDFAHIGIERPLVGRGIPFQSSKAQKTLVNEHGRIERRKSAAFSEPGPREAL